ncbi:MAG: TerB family tellurite resistance protein [Deltaproteobacteria bacterium]|nr:TerB family tellurite resistance protein [Deltaproteobacteria bacterium]MBN2674320.1 TerB family tellurite resistance protein [Deltaproteobacteria bacterium]
MEIREKIQICEVVAQAILADGQITDSEKNFMNSLMDKYELTDDQKKQVMARNIGDDPAQMVKGISGFESTNQLIVELVMAVAADDKLTKTEQNLLNTVAEAIGVDQSDMDMLVKNALM